MDSKAYKILYVDDSAVNLELFKENFRLDYTVLLAESGKQGLKILEENEISVIVTDLRMAEMSGIKFLENAIKINKLAPRIILTAYGDYKSVRTAVNKVQIFQFVTKPYTSNDLRLVIENALNLYKIQQQNIQLSKELLDKTNRLEEELKQKDIILEQLKTSEHNFKKNQIYLHNLIDTAGTIIIVLSLDIKIVEWNNEAEELFGKNKDQVIFKDFYTLFKQNETEQLYRDEIEYLMANGKSKPFEAKICNKSDCSHTILWNLSIFFDDYGEKIGIILVGQNIDSIKEAQRKRKESERLYRLLAENTNDVIWTMDAKCKFTYISPAIKRLRGYSPEEALNQSIEEAFVPKSSSILTKFLDDFFSKLKKGIKSKSSERFQLQQPCKDGRVAWIEVITNKVFDEEDNFLFFLGASRDITDRILAEQELRLSEEKFSKVFQSSPDAIILSSLKDGLLIDLNNKAYELTGYEPNEVVGATTLELNIWDDLEERSSYIDILKKSNKATNQEAHFRMKSGEVKTGLISGEIISINSQKFVLSIIRDITTRKIEEEKLRISEAKFATVFNSSPDAIIISKLETGEVIDSNLQFSQMMSIPKHKIIGKTTHEIGFWINKADRASILMEYQENGYVSNYETQYNVNETEPSIGLISGEVILLQGEKYILEIIRDITIRKKWEETLKSSEERFRTIFENSVVGYYRTNQDGEIILANPTLYKMLGYSSIDELKERNLRKEEFAEHNPREDIIRKIEEDGQVVDFESVWHKKDGSEIIVSESARIITGTDNNEQFFDGTVVDISDRKRTEQALIRSESLFKAITEQAIEGISLLNLDYEFILTNYAFIKMTGYSATELKGISVYKIMAQENAEDFLAKVKKLGYGSKELQLIRKDSSRFYAEIKANLVKIDGQEMILGLVNDVTERFEAEKALRRSEGRLREAQKIAHFGHWDYNFVDNTMEWSDEVYKIFGLDNKSFKPTLENSAELIYLDDRESVHNTYNNAVTKKKKYKNTHRIVRSDGEIRYVTEYARTTYDKDGNPRKSLATVQDVTEIKEAEKKIRLLNEGLEKKVRERTIEFQESERKFRDLIQFVPDGIALVDKNGKIKLVNNKLKELFGYTEKELLEKSIDVLLPEKLRSKHKVHFQKFINKPQNREMGLGMDLLGLSKKGLTFPVDIRLGVVNIDNELNVIVIIRDISKRKKDQAELLKLTQAIEQSPVSIIITDKNGLVEYVNPMFTHDSGYKPKEIIGKSTALLTADPSNDNLLTEQIKYLQEDKVWRGDILNRRKNNELFWVKVLLAPIFDEKGDISNYISVQTDITEAKKKEELLKFTTYSFDNAADAAYWLDSETGNFIHANKVGISRLGYSEEEFVGLNVLDIDGNFKTQDDWVEFSNGLKTKGDITIESLYIKKSGEVFPVEIIASTIEYEGKNYFIAFVRDITEKQRANEELKNAKIIAESANRTKTEFLANMSHEIRTPMNAVLGITDLLFQQITDEVQLSYLNTIKSSGKLLLSIINNILDISRIEAGKFEVNNKYFNLKASMKELESMFVFKAQEKGIKLSTTFAPGIPQNICLDELRFRQILTNLLSNSIKFTHTGFVELVAEVLREPESDTDEFGLRIKVIDSGVGIDEEYKDKVFDAFTQQEGQDSKKYGGSGLGLAISRRLVELMDGELSMESTKNEGTLFIVDFHRVKYSSQQTERKVVSSPAIKKQDFLSSKVLIVDDVEENRRYLTGALSGTAIEVFVAKDGQEAYELAVEKQPDLILTDLIMPVLDGFELSEKVKKNSDLKDIPIIANSAAVIGLDPERLKSGYFDVFVPKPVPLGKLYQLLAKYLPRKEESIQQNSFVESEIKMKLAKEVKVELLDKTLELWNLLQQHQKISRLEEFSKIIKTVGEKYNVKELLDYSKTLDSAIKAFDISAILAQLNLFRQYF